MVERVKEHVSSNAGRTTYRLVGKLIGSYYTHGGVEFELSVAELICMQTSGIFHTWISGATSPWQLVRIILGVN